MRKTLDHPPLGWISRGECQGDACLGRCATASEAPTATDAACCVSGQDSLAASLSLGTID